MGPLCIPIRGQLVNPVAVDSKTHSAGAAQKSGEAPQFSIVEQLKSSWWRAPERTRVFVGVPKLLLCTAGARAAAGGGGRAAVAVAAAPVAPSRLGVRPSPGLYCAALLLA